MDNMDGILEKRFERETGIRLDDYNLDNYKIFEAWYQNLLRYNKMYAEVIKDMVRKDDCLLELATSYDEAIINNIDVTYHKLITLDRRPKIQDKSLRYRVEKNPDQLSCYFVCNGLFKEGMTVMNQVLQKGHFIMGVCGDKHTDFFKNSKVYYKGLRNFCINNGINVGVIEENLDSKGDVKIYALTHNLKGRMKK